MIYSLFDLKVNWFQLRLMAFASHAPACFEYQALIVEIGFSVCGTWGNCYARFLLPSNAWLWPRKTHYRCHSSSSRCDASLRTHKQQIQAHKRRNKLEACSPNGQGKQLEVSSSKYDRNAKSLNLDCGHLSRNEGEKKWYLRIDSSPHYTKNKPKKTNKTNPNCLCP